MTNRQLALAPSVQISVERYDEMVQFVQAILKDGLDFGMIPGTGKPTLFKPGAEKLCKHFGLTSRFTEVQVVEDWSGADHKGEPFFYYKIKCELFHGETYVAECIASCNSWEERYRYRKSGRVCPNCGKDAIIKGKLEFGGGWLCFAKKGGCGSKFKTEDPTITSQTEGQISNPNIFDQVNTLVKQAQKRALVGATLIAVSASEFFTQDMEDLAPIQSDWTETKEKPAEKAQPTEKAKPVARQSQPPEEPPSEYEEVVEPKEHTEHGITYLVGGAKTLVKFGADWRPADEQVVLSKTALEQAEALFKNKFEMSGHLEKHFKVKLISSLTWEQFLGFLNHKKKNINNPKWYVDKAEALKPVAPPKEGVLDQELADFYDPDRHISAADMNDFLVVIATLPNPRGLKILLDNGLSVEKNWEDITNIAAIVAGDPQVYLGQDGVTLTPELMEYIEYAKSNSRPA